jgi:hypothetical protein
MNLARWHGPFESANQAGLIIALAVVTLLWFSGRPVIFAGRLQSSMSALAILLLIAATIVLASTQSRAGGLAVIGGIGLLWWWKACDRWSSITAAVGILAIMVSWPGGGDRALVAVEDAVRGERPVLAAASLALSWDHWSCGLGGQFASTLGAWYLPTKLEGRFATGLNDFLTLAGQFGLPLASLFVGTLIALGWAAARQRADRLICLLAALVLVHVICGQFQAHLWYFWTRITFGICLTLLIGRLVWLNRASLKTGWVKPIAVVAGSSVLVLAVVSMAAWIAAGYHPVATRLTAGFPEAYVRDQQTSAGHLLYVDTVRGAKRFRRGIAAQALEDHFSVLIVPTMRDLHAAFGANAQGTKANVAVASQDRGVELWAYARSDPGLLAVVLDPTQVPDASVTPPTGLKSRVLVIATEHSAFIPEKAALDREIARDAVGSVVSWVSRNRTDDSVWEAIKTFATLSAPANNLTREP